MTDDEFASLAQLCECASRMELERVAPAAIPMLIAHVGRLNARLDETNAHLEWARDDGKRLAAQVAALRAAAGEERAS